MVYLLKSNIAARGLNCIWSLHEYQTNENTCDTFQQQLNKRTGSDIKKKSQYLQLYEYQTNENTLDIYQHQLNKETT